MTTFTVTTTSMRTTGATTATRAPAAATTAARFLGHFLAALVGVAFLGRDLEH